MISLFALLCLFNILQVDVSASNSMLYSEEKNLNTARRTYEELEVTEIAVNGNSTDDTHLFLIVLEEGLYNAIGADLIDLWVDVIFLDGVYNSIYVVEMN